MATPPLLHRTADFRGVQAPAVRDAAALAGLALSAAGAAGLTTTEAPIVRALPRDGLALMVFLDQGHMTVHTFPDREIVVVDLLVPAGRDPQHAAGDARADQRRLPGAGPRPAAQRPHPGQDRPAGLGVRAEGFQWGAGSDAATDPCRWRMTPARLWARRDELGGSGQQ